jgi:hypothetical protein
MNNIAIIYANNYLNENPEDSTVAALLKSLFSAAVISRLRKSGSTSLVYVQHDGGDDEEWADLTVVTLS